MPAKPYLEVCLTPMLLPLFSKEDSIIVVIDILRATSTICVALDNKVEKVIPVETIAECKKFEEEKNCILAAERRGEKVNGFSFGNSPFEYLENNVAGKTLVLTTTNGTRSFEMSHGAHEVVAGAFLNLDILCEWLMEQKKNVILLCAGWKNKVNMEDTLFAGAVAHRLTPDTFHSECDSTLGAKYLYLKTKENLYQIMQYSSHYKRLSDLGIKKDIQYCLTPNLNEVIPVMKNNEIVLLGE